MSIARKGILCAILLIAGWHAARAEQALTLGSGKTVEIVSIGPLQSTHGWSALMLTYLAVSRPDDIDGLRSDADEIWEQFVANAEHSGYQAAVIGAKYPTGSYNFVFEKRAGSWHTFATKDRIAAKLDGGYVRAFLAHLDRLFEWNEMNALLLYMADDWTVTVSDPAQHGAPPQRIDRTAFVAQTHAAFAAATARQHRREIIRVEIGDTRDTARVASRETEELTVNGTRLAGVEFSTDSFALRDGMMLWTASASVIEKRTETKSD